MIYDDGAELGALAAALNGGPRGLAVLTELDPRDFASEARQALFASMKALAASGRPIDAFTLISELQRTGDLERVGGRVAVMKLENQPAAEHSTAYIGRLREKSALRRFKAEALRQAELAETAKDAAAFVREAGSAVLGVMSDRAGGPEASSAWALSYARELEAESQSTEAPRLQTGQWLFDHNPAGGTGGLRRGSSTVVAARPGIGKTSLGLNVAFSMAKAGRHVLVVSLEMTKRECLDRIVAIDTGIDSQLLGDPRKLTADQWALVTKSLRSLSQMQLTIWVPPEADLASIRLQSLSAHAARPLDLVVIDYLQLVRCRAANREQEVASVSRGLKALAKEINSPLMVLSQFNREIERRDPPTPRLSDLRESGAVEQDADAIVALHTDGSEPNGDTQEVTATYLKDRFGPRRHYQITFKPACQRFED